MPTKRTRRSRRAASPLSPQLRKLFETGAWDPDDLSPESIPVWDTGWWRDRAPRLWRIYSEDVIAEWRRKGNTTRTWGECEGWRANYKDTTQKARRKK